MAEPDVRAAIAAAYSQGETPRLVSLLPSGRDEMWAIGDCAFVAPVVPPDASPDLEYAVRTRRDALLTGECDHCGATPEPSSVVGQGATTRAVALFAHRPNCPAADERVAPRLREHWAASDTRALPERMREASVRTGAEMRSSLDDQEVIASSPAAEEWFERRVEEMFAERARRTCPHIAAEPAQKWSAFIAEGIWYCGECWARVRESLMIDGPRLAFLEEHTCDVCRRYVRTMNPLIGRYDHLVLHGGICPACLRKMAAQ